MPERSSEPVVLFDGTCGFCRAAVRTLANRFSLTGRLLPWQSADLAAYGLTEQQVQARMWFVHGDRRSSGAAAFAAWAATGDRRARAAGRILSVPGIAQAAALGYWIVARNRHRIPGPWEHSCTI
jgi:predicted DCC family thiol-disulfide oxidoreductase YuxK